MKQTLKNLGRVLYAFLVLIGFIGAADAAFGLMNQSSTLSFVGGLAILVVLLFFVVAAAYYWHDRWNEYQISKQVKSKNKKQK